MTPALALAGIRKEYVLLEERGGLLRSMLPFGSTRRARHRALWDVDLTIEPGEAVGILGRNGAGKSTLLRLMAGVTQPSAGTVSVHGRLAPLLSVGVGFHAEMSGRENVYVNGMLLGLTRAEVDARYDEIVAFSELGEAIDTPVKFYSSGMYMRLGFAVAIHTDPDVLLVDEVLAVGDLAFQLKCFDRMRVLKERGTTIVIVSHSMHAIRLLCPRAVLLAGGAMIIDGPVEDVVARHHALLSETAPTGDDAGGVRIIRRELVGGSGVPGRLERGERATVRFHLVFEVPAVDPVVHLTVLADDRSVVDTASAPLTAGPVPAGHEVRGEFDLVTRLNGGSYRFALAVTDDGGRRELHRDASGSLAYVTPVLGTSGIADLDASIHLGGVDLTDHPEVAL